MAHEVFANAAQTTLAAPMLSTDVTMTVTSAAAFPLAGNFRILIDQEIILVRAVSSNTFSSLGRGAELFAGGGPAANHPNGATVTCILTSGALQQAESDVQPLYGTAIASRPSAPSVIANQTFTPSNFPIVSQSNGSLWSDLQVNPWVIGAPWSSTGFSWVNQGTASVITTNGGAEFHFPIVNGDTLHIFEQSFTNTQTTIMLLCATAPSPALWSCSSFFGFTMRRPASNAQVNACGFLSQNSVALSIYNQNWTNATTFGSTVSNIVATFSPSLPYSYCWLKRTDDGTNQHFYVSNNGIHWSTIAVYAHATGLSGVPTTIGIFGYNSGANANTDDLVLHVASWNVT